MRVMTVRHRSNATVRDTTAVTSRCWYAATSHVPPSSRTMMASTNLFCKVDLWRLRSAATAQASPAPSSPEECTTAITCTSRSLTTTSPRAAAEGPVGLRSIDQHTHQRSTARAHTTDHGEA